MSVPPTKNTIKELLQLALKDIKNSNTILDLLVLAEENNVKISTTSCQALSQIFSKYLTNSSMTLCGLNNSTETDKERKKPEEIFNIWLNEQFKSFVAVLCGNLHADSSQSQKIAAENLSTLMKAIKTAEDQWNFVLKAAVDRLSEISENETKPSAEIVEILSKAKDSSSLCTFCLAQVKKTVKDKQVSDKCLFFSWKMVKTIITQKLDPKAQKMLTGAVCQILKNKLPIGLYKDVLSSLSKVMDKMSSPLLLTDFLTESFNLGGAISLMCLNSLFVLIHKYNLEYPDFYGKLYSMFEPQVFSAKYRTRFFHLADLFLTSTHLPSYLVAAFAKRLARLSLHAPTPCLKVTIPFILNLLNRHPTCHVLLHRPSGMQDIELDPFLPEESDLSMTKALDSCLWELQSLERHVNPEVAIKARKRTIAEVDLSSFLETSYQDLFEPKKIKRVPVTFLKPTQFLPNSFTF